MQTESLSSSLPGHERQAEAQAHGVHRPQEGTENGHPPGPRASSQQGQEQASNPQQRQQQQQQQPQVRGTGAAVYSRRVLALSQLLEAGAQTPDEQAQQG